VVERDQRVGFRIVGRGISPRRRIRYEAEVLRAPFLDAAVGKRPLRHHVDAITVSESGIGDVVRVAEHDPAPTFHAAIAVVEAP
jgi:hypothetical protein